MAAKKHNTEGEKMEYGQKDIVNGSRVVTICNMNTAGIFESRLYVNHGETATLTCAKHKTLKGAERWAQKVLAR